MCLVFFSGPASISHQVDYDSPSVRLVSDQYEAAAPLVEMIIAPRFQTLGCHTILFTIRYNVMLCHIMSHNVTQYFSWQYNVTLCHTTSHNTFQYTGHSTFLLIVMNYWTNTKHNTGQNTTLDNWPSSVSRDNHQSLCSKSVLSHNVIVHWKKEHQGNIWWTLKNWNQMAPFKNYFATHSRDAKGASQYKKIKRNHRALPHFAFSIIPNLHSSHPASVSMLLNATH